VKTSIVLLIGLFFLLSLPSSAQWIQTNGPYGGTILSLAVVDSVVIAGTQYCGAYYSTDCGDNWSPIEGIPRTADISCLAVCGHTIVAATEIAGSVETGLFISTDDGKNWHRSAAQYRGRLVFSDSVLFSGGWGVQRSTDFGETWNVTDGNLNHLDVASLAVAHPTDSTSGSRIYAATDSGLFVSTNVGATWTEVDSGIGEKYLVAVAATGMNVIVSTFHSGVFFSTDGGATWSAANTQMNQCDCFVVSDSTIFAGTGAGLFRSTDKGDNWTPASNFPAVCQSVHALAVDPRMMSDSPPILLAGVYWAGVFRSTDNGASWEPVCRGIRAYSIDFVGIVSNGNGGTNLIAECLDGFGGLFVSTDDGASWRGDTTASIFQYEIRSLLEAGNNIYVSAGGIFRSKDHGITWSAVDSGLDNPVNIGTKIDDFWTLALMGTDIYAGDLWVFRSTNGGDSWIRRGQPILYNDKGSNECEVKSLAVLDSEVFAGTFCTGVFRSTDKGVTWTAIDNGFTSTDLLTLAASDNTIFVTTGDAGIFRSTNRGADWSPIDSGLTSGNVPSLAICGKQIFGGTFGGGVCVAKIGGTRWTPVNSGLTPTDVFSLAASSTELYCATRFGGIWRRPLSEMTAVESKNTASPTQYILRQNYPNPFNPSTVIGYELPHSEFVYLRVYDVLGREVETLVYQRQNAGVYSITLNAAHLASGAYFYRLDAGSFHDIKKFIVVK